jgi:tight adherence protein C
MTTEAFIMLIAFLSATSGALLVYTLVGARRTRLDERLESLDERAGAALSLGGAGIPSGLPGDPDPGNSAPRQAPPNQFTQTTLPKLGTALMHSDEAEKSRLRISLVHAGFYGRQAMAVFLGVKLILMVAPALIGLAVGLTGVVPTEYGFLGGACCGILGMIGPSFWLDNRKTKRQTSFRRSLPDALDLLVICLEGGLSLSASLRRVGTELRTAHPVLAGELSIVQREIQLGSSPGEALQKMGVRTDLEEIRSLASVITQSERFGASLVKSLRVHAETLRLKRQQRAEELAQKAAVKVLFPTMLLIFPAIFVVILGPAVFQIVEQLGQVIGS